MHLRPLLLLCVLLCIAGSGVAEAQVSPTPDSVQVDTTGADTPRTDAPRTEASRTEATRPDTTTADTTGGETGKTAPQDPAAQASSPEGASSERPSSEGSSSGGVDKPVTLTSRDSLVITFSDTGGDLGTLYGDSEIKYEDATLKARVVEMNFDRDQVRAYGRRRADPDSAGQGDIAAEPPPRIKRERVGNVIGRPQRQAETPDSLRQAPPSFTQGSDQSFTGSELSFNLATNRGRVVSARTEAQEREGFVTGQTVKVYEDSTLFVEDGSYTTCDCEPDETPSYSLRSNQMKVKGKWVYTGPIQMYLFEVPTPLWLPFGFLPNTQGRRSGPLPPQYGQERRGLYLRDWGWYFAMNDYMDLTIRAGVYSQGSYELRPRFRYDKRYRYRGTLELGYIRNRIGEPEDPNPTRSREGNLRWQHTQTLSPTASLDGNVNLVTRGDYLQNNAETVQDAIRRTINSQIRYQKSWPDGGRSLKLSVLQNQQLSSGSATVQLPSLTFSQRQFNPFKFGETLNDPRWYERIRASYTGGFDNNYSFQRSSSREETLREEGDLEAANAEWYDAIFDPDLYRRATGQNEPPLDPTITHRVPLSASYQIPRFNVNVSPNISTSSNWFLYSKQLTQRTEIVPDDPETEADESGVNVIREPENVQGFYSQSEFSTGLSFSTEVFGVFPVKAGRFEGLLHRFSPSISVNYQPNFNDPFWGQTEVLRDENGDIVRQETSDESLGEVLYYDRRTGRVTQLGSEQLGLSFNVGNEFETKRVRVDSTGERQEERFKFLQVNLNSSYNFAAEEFNLSDVRMNARVLLSDIFTLQANFNFSPYQFEVANVREDGEISYREINVYEAVDTPWSPLRFTSMSLRTDFQFSSNGTSSPGTGPRRAQNTRRGPQGQAVPGGAAGAADPYAAYRTQTGFPRFDTQWNVELDLSYNLDKAFVEYDQRALVGVQGGFRPTPKWRLDVRSDVNIVDARITTASMDVSRDLGCWVLSFNWRPIGAGRFGGSYGLSLRVKQGMLSNLLRLDVPRGGNGSVIRDIGGRVGQTAGGAAGVGGRF